jgi:hypothetical protein
MQFGHGRREACGFAADRGYRRRRGGHKAGEGDTLPAKTKVLLRVVAAASALTLTACATASEPRIEVREVRVPVAVKCATDPGPRPEYPDTDAALAAVKDVFEASKLVMAGRALRIGREAELEAAVSGCR